MQNYIVQKITTFVVCLVVLGLLQACSPVQMSAVDTANEKASAPDANQQGDPDGGGNANPGLPSPEDDNEELIAKCGNVARFLRTMPTLPADSNLSGLRGNSIYKARSLNAASDIRGNLVLVGVVANATINNLSAVYGNIIICDMSIKSVNNFTHGHLVVVGGNIENVDDFHGNIRLIGGKITGKVTNSTGNF